MHFIQRLPTRIALSVEILASYLRVRRLLSKTDFQITLAKLRSGSRNRTVQPDDVAEALRLGYATVRVLDALPTDSRCLMRSLVLSSLLERRGIRGLLVIGVRPGETPSAGIVPGESFGAHAWVEVNSRPVLESGNGQFARLVEL